MRTSEMVMSGWVVLCEICELQSAVKLCSGPDRSQQRKCEISPRPSLSPTRLNFVAAASTLILPSCNQEASFCLPNTRQDAAQSDSTLDGYRYSGQQSSDKRNAVSRQAYVLFCTRVMACTEELLDRADMI